MSTHPPDSETPLSAYDVRQRIAVGTAGVVYRAEHRDTGESVLFKVLFADAGYPLDAKLVLGLAPNLKRLRIPHAAQLKEAVSDPEGCILIYPDCQGTAGNLLFRQQALPPHQAYTIAKQFVEAWEAGAKLKRPHGDIKPSNVVLSEVEGVLQIQIQDWGLSICRREHPPETLQFMAPERLLGKPPSAQGDLFSIGATLFYFLTSASPIDPANGASSIASVWESFDGSVIDDLRADLHPAFREWIKGLLAASPQKRPLAFPDFPLSGELASTEPVTLPPAVGSVSLGAEEVDTTAPTELLQDSPVESLSLEPSRTTKKGSAGLRWLAVLLGLVLFLIVLFAALLALPEKEGADWVRDLRQESAHALQQISQIFTGQDKEHP